MFAAYRIDEQIAKGLDRKVWLPSGGSLVIDRTEAMTVVDVNTGKFTGSGGNLEETVTKNNLEAAEEIVRQLRLRDIGGIIVVDFIDMVLESNRDLVLRRLVECLGRDRTRHQVAEVTSLGLVQMTRKRIGTGLLEAFSENCEHCQGRGVVVHDHPVEAKRGGGDDESRAAAARRGGRRGRRVTRAARRTAPKAVAEAHEHAEARRRPKDVAAMARPEAAEAAAGGPSPSLRPRGRAPEAVEASEAVEPVEPEAPRYRDARARRRDRGEAEGQHPQPPPQREPPGRRARARGRAQSRARASPSPRPSRLRGRSPRRRPRRSRPRWSPGPAGAAPAAPPVRRPRSRRPRSRSQTLPPPVGAVGSVGEPPLDGVVEPGRPRDAEPGAEDQPARRARPDQEEGLAQALTAGAGGSGRFALGAARSVVLTLGARPERARSVPRAGRRCSRVAPQTQNSL